MKYIGFPIRFLFLFGIVFTVIIVIGLLEVIIQGTAPWDNQDAKHKVRELWRASVDGINI